MKLISLKTLAGALMATVLLVGNYAKAGYLNGQIEFYGAGVVVTPGALTQILPADNAIVSFGTSGSFAGLFGDLASFENVTFAPATPGLLWTVNTGTELYSFTISTFTTVSQNGTFVNLSGTGVATEVGTITATPTGGTWSITDTSTGGATFTFGSSANVSNTPDSGTTALLIALGLAGIGLGIFAQRRMSAKA